MIYNFEITTNEKIAEAGTVIENELEAYLLTNFEFKFNEVTGRVSWKTIGSQEFKELDDYDLNSFKRLAKRKRVRCVKSELLELLISDFTPKYNPFQLYLDSLDEWDGETDYIAQFSETVRTTNQPLWEKCLRKWIVGMVGSIINDEVVNQTAPIFSGGQGIGKTTWIGNLVPQALKRYFHTGTINMANKDSITQLSECILIDMDELENLSRKTIGDLKSLMTRKHIRIRRPYGKVAENLPRRASFIGSINRKEFLRDETGSRRFLCFEIESINNEHKISIDMVYTQALALFKSGFQFWFDKGEEKEIQLNNEQFQNTSLEMELLLKHFEPALAEQATHFMSANDIADVLNDREGLIKNNSTLQHLGKALAAKKFVNVSRNNRKVWAVVDKIKMAA